MFASAITRDENRRSAVRRGAVTHGGSFYDEPGVLARYAAATPGISDPRATMEWPALREVLGDVAGDRVLDLGCGDAAVAGWLLARGAASYLGVDGSAAMVRRAAEDLPDGAQVRLGAIEDLDVDAGSADLVLSRLALLRECAPERELFGDDAEYRRRRRIPRFLLLAADR